MIRSGAGCAVPRMPATDAATSRKRFLTIGATGAAGALLAACGRDSKKPVAAAPAKPTMAARDARARDIEIVNYALTLEHIEADFYDQVVRSGVVKDRTVLELAKRFGETERLHVGALSFAVSGLGGKPAAKPKTTFEDVPRRSRSIRSRRATRPPSTRSPARASAAAGRSWARSPTERSPGRWAWATCCGPSSRSS